MKTGYFIILLSLISFTSYSQKYLDNITKDACGCLENISDTLNKTSVNMEMGLCIIDAAIPYKKQLWKDFEIDIDQIDIYGEELGKIIGVRMASVCPKTLIKVTKMSGALDKIEEDTQEIRSIQIIKGEIIKVNKEQFVEFTLKDEMNTISNFYWLGAVKSNFDFLTEYMNLKGKMVSISFETFEFFDPKLEIYRQFKTITEINME